MILDAAPTLAGTWVLAMRTGEEPEARPQTPEERARRDDPALPAEARVRFTPHWATCPEAKRFRSKGQAEKAGEVE